MSAGLSPSLTVGLVYDDSLDRPGGVAQHVEMLARGLRTRGHRVALLVGQSHDPVLDGQSLARNVHVRFNGNRLSIPLWARGAVLDAAMAKLRPDILHVQMPYSPLLAGRLISRAAPNTAVVGTSHVFSERLLVVGGAFLLGRACIVTHRRFDRVLAVSQPARAFAERYGGIGVDAVVPNMVDVEALRVAAQAASAVDDRGRTIVFVGSLVPRKCVGALLEALHTVLSQHPDVRLLIAGDGPLRRRLVERAEQLRVQTSVDFLGQVDEPTKARLLASADVACFPSAYGESFGVVLLEAMAAGAGAVLGGDNPGYRTLLRDRPDALVDSRDPQRLGQALADCLAGARESELRRRWQERLVARYDVNVVCDQVLEHYAQALSARRGPRAYGGGHKRAA